MTEIEEEEFRKTVTRIVKATIDKAEFERAFTISRAIVAATESPGFQNADFVYGIADTIVRHSLRVPSGLSFDLALGTILTLARLIKEQVDEVTLEEAKAHVKN